jgi:outer membrane immunogenic protein
VKKVTLRLLACGFLIASPAFAADMAVKAPPSPASAPFSWTGFYAGIAGGLAWGQSQFIDADPTDASFGLPITKKFDVSGGIFGGTVGYNWQVNNWVAGVEGDFSWLTKQGISNGIPPFATGVSDTTREHWLGTGRVRLGVVPVDRRLFYVTGGFALRASRQSSIPTSSATAALTRPKRAGAGLQAAGSKRRCFRISR